MGFGLGLANPNPNPNPNSFAMSVDGKEVFNVSTGKVERGTLKLVADGQVVVPSGLGLGCQGDP